jgi:hypothetical protein
VVQGGTGMYRVLFWLTYLPLLVQNNWLIVSFACCRR